MSRSVTPAEVAAHNTRDDCWITVNGQAYDVTRFLESHPGGAKVILAYAGKDASDDFTMLHRPGILEKIGKRMIVGKMAARQAAAPAGAVSAAEVAKHNTREDCWITIDGQAYNVTPFLDSHPGGAKVILAYAGKDATGDFTMLHRPGILEKYGKRLKVGPMTSPSHGTMARRPASGGTRMQLGRRPVSSARVVTVEELAKHATKGDCWTAIHGRVYDVTQFQNDHPGGARILVKYAGTDATGAFDAAAHPKDIAEQLGLEDTIIVGMMEANAKFAAVAEPARKPRQQKAPASAAPAQASQAPPAKPQLDQILNLFDFEAVAKSCLTEQGWAYYSSGADDEVTLRENHSAFQRIWFRPKTLVNVAKIDLSSKIMGFDTSFPVYITATALGKLAHPEGEVVLTRAAHAQKIVQMCPTLASCTLEEMTSAAQPGQTQFFQLYVNHNREVTRKMIERCKAGGIKVICVTVDAPQLGRREKDMRMKFTEGGSDVQTEDDNKGKVNRGEGAARAISQFIDPSLCWDDIAWLKEICHPMKLVLKGVQTAEDAVRAVDYGLDGVILSNHGGRQLDFARSGIEVLTEVMDALDAINARDKLEVWIDGGIRRGSDIIKAIAIGAKAVGLGRPCLYSLASYGQDGVEHMLQILKDEMVMCMRLVGAPSIKHITRSMVMTDSITSHIVPVPEDKLAAAVYEPIIGASKL